MKQIVKRSCWCGGKSANRIGVLEIEGNQHYPLVRCDKCGVYSIFPQPSDEELIEAYSSDYYGTNRRKFSGPIAWLIEYFQRRRACLAARHTPPGGRVLDIGCGNGGFLIQMKRRGFHVEGTERTEASAARVPRDEYIPVHIGDLLALDLPHSSYDMITLWHVFEHVREPDRTLERIKKLLRHGGTVIFSMPNVESIQATRFGRHWFHHDPPRHLFGFSRQSLGRMLALTEFKVISFNTFSLEQNPFGYIQSWLNASRFPRDRLYSTLKGIGDTPRHKKMVDYLLMTLLLQNALVFSTLESFIGRGATMTVVARRIG